MTEHEREVAREVEHERAPEGEQAPAAEPASEHEREVARQSEHERAGQDRGEGFADAGITGTLDVQPEDPRTEGRESPDPID